MKSGSNLALVQDTEFGDGDGGGPPDLRWLTIALLEEEVAEARALMRRLLDSDGAEATEVMAEAERYLEAHEQADREEENERARDRHYDSSVCDCGTFKGVGTSYCPECDAHIFEQEGWEAPKPFGA